MQSRFKAGIAVHECYGSIYKSWTERWLESVRIEENRFHREGRRRASSLPCSNRTKQSLKDLRLFFTFYDQRSLGILETFTTILKKIGWHEKECNPM